MSETLEKKWRRPDTDVIELKINGMTCTSCAGRVEKQLNKLENVESANVNFATEVATVKLKELDPQQDIILEELIRAVQSAGYEADPYQENPQKSTNIYTIRLLTAVVVFIPVAIFSFAPSLRPPAWKDIALAMAAFIVIYCGWPFHKATVANLKHAALTMDSLVSLGTGAAFIWSAVVTFANLNAPVYFDEAVGITAVILVGRFLEDKAKHQASDLLGSLFELGVKEVTVLRNNREELVDIKQLKIGDTFIVKPGGKIAADGTVLSGVSAVDCSIITGESLPVEVKPEDRVIGATINTYGELYIRADKVGENTALAEIARLVAEAQGKKANIQKLADRIASVFIPVVVAISLLTFMGWSLLGHDVNSGFIAAIAVLVVACPCAMGLATPIALMVGISRGAKLGILIKDPSVLERTRQVTSMVFDKTGTITDGNISVRKVISAVPDNEREVLSLAASLEKSSEHPIGQAVYGHGLKEKIPLLVSKDFVAVPGQGIRASIGSDQVFVGKKSFLTENNIFIPQDIKDQGEYLESQRESVVFIAKNSEAIGLISLVDTIKDHAKESIDAIKTLGIRPIMITGDNDIVARNVGDVVGIKDVLANASPKEKALRITDLQSRNEIVAMVGDGVNDAPALVTADLSIAIGAGSDIASAASDIILMGNDLTVVAEAIMLSRKTLAIIKSNLVWAFSYNIVAIPLAMLAIINPMTSAAFMSFSSIFVVLNALRLKSFRLSKGNMNERNK